MSARILIVDDVPANVRLLEAKLAAEFYESASAKDGFEALTKAREWQPDLILLDVMMPRMDGFECCRQLKADPATRDIPVVMVTALGEPSERLVGLEAGADDFLTKPPEHETLLARVRSLVRLKRLMDEVLARGDTARALGLDDGAVMNSSVKGTHALIVDDWEINARGVAAALAREGIISVRAQTGMEAVALAAAESFGLIAINLSLAGEDGLKLIAALRGGSKTHETPILLLAAPEAGKLIVRGFELGASDWLTLPVDENELRVRARNQIRRKMYQDRLRSNLGSALELALVDPLTGLYNQRFLMSHLSSLIENGQGRPLGVLMVDADHFKRVNDQHGHAVGDKALRMIADTLRVNTRPFDTLARYGGEEFVVVMPGTDPADAMAVAERLRSAVESAVVTTPEGQTVHVTLSVGVGCSIAERLTPEALLHRADTALYQAKRGGRNRVEVALPPAST